MQKLKNILGSRKKGAQEPHAARDPRYDYQGNTTSNLKGISLESLTLSAGLTRYCMCPLFFPLFPSTIEDVCLILFKMCVCVFWLSPLRELGPDAGWVQEYGGSSHQYGLSDKSLAAAAYWWAGRLMVDLVQSPTYVLTLLSQNKLYIYVLERGLSGNRSASSIIGLIHPEPCWHNAEYWKHHRGTWIYIPAAGTHGQGAGGDHPEVTWSWKWGGGWNEIYDREIWRWCW